MVALREVPNPRQITNEDLEESKAAALFYATRAAEEEISFWDSCGIHEGDVVTDPITGKADGIHTFGELTGQTYGVFHTGQTFTVHPIKRNRNGQLPAISPDLAYMFAVRLRDMTPVVMESLPTHFVM
jgi:hypothetical protein